MLFEDKNCLSDCPLNTLVVRVIERQDRGKNCPAAIFTPRQPGVLLGPLGKDPDILKTVRVVNLLSVVNLLPRSLGRSMRNEGDSDPFPHPARGSLRPFFSPQKGKPRTSQNPLSETQRTP